mgnify:CR=1 FL=1
MSKMSELSQVLDDMIACGEGMIKAARTIQEIFSSTEEPSEKPKKQSSKDVQKQETANPVPAKEEPAVKQYSKEEVRGLLARKTKEDNGRFKDAVRALVQKYGNGGTFGNVDAKDYAALVAEVEGLNNA